MKSVFRYSSNKAGLKTIRKKLRNNSTSAEAALWNMIKNKQLEGRKFRRQHSIGNYIVDFYCSSERLIIELDGDPHGDYIKIQEDEKRDKILEELGYKVLRYENRLIFQDPEFVSEIIKSRFNLGLLRNSTTSLPAGREYSSSEEEEK